MQQKNWLIDSTKNSGFIYLLSNKTYTRSVKIGRTTQLPCYRAAELSSSTGVPEPFKVEYARFVERDLDLIEGRIHEVLAEFRVNNKREFFDLPVAEAVKKVDQIIDEYFTYKFGEITYRNTQDARWGCLFDYMEVPFEYLKEPVELNGDNEFRPDFWLPAQNCFLVICQDLLSKPLGRLAALFFAEKTGKVLIVFWDCQPGIERSGIDGEDLIFHTGWSITPEGEIGGCIEWGGCEECGSWHVGHLGSAELGDSKGRNTSPVRCRCFFSETHPELLRGYQMVRHIFDRELIP